MVVDVVDNLVREDECQLSLVLHLSHEAGVDENHALWGGEGIDLGTLDGVDAQLAAQFGLVGQQGVDNAIEHLCHWVAEEDAASRKQLADAEGDSLDGSLVFHTATGHLGCALQVAFIELFVGQFQICGQRALAAEGLLCIGSQVEGQQE